MISPHTGEQHYLMLSDRKPICSCAFSSKHSRGSIHVQFKTMGPVCLTLTDGGRRTVPTIHEGTYCWNSLNRIAGTEWLLQGPDGGMRLPMNVPERNEHSASLFIP